VYSTHTIYPTHPHPHHPSQRLSHSSNLLPTKLGTSTPLPIARSISNLARQPVQWPARSAFGPRACKSATVEAIISGPASARWKPPMTAWSGVFWGPRETPWREALTTPAWLQPVKRIRPLSGARELRQSVYTST